MTSDNKVVTIYGIKNCDTMKKAFVWLSQHQIDYQFHDYKKSGAPEALVSEWIDMLGWETLINRKGTTWRKLDEHTRNSMNAERALRLAVEQPSIIKRPIVIKGGKMLSGFTTETWAAFFTR